MSQVCKGIFDFPVAIGLTYHLFDLTKLFVFQGQDNLFKRLPFFRREQPVDGNFALFQALSQMAFDGGEDKTAFFGNLRNG